MIPDESVTRERHPFQEMVVGKLQEVFIKRIVQQLKEGQSFFHLKGNAPEFCCAVNLVDDDRFQVETCRLGGNKVEKKSEFVFEFITSRQHGTNGFLIHIFLFFKKHPEFSWF